MTLTKQIIKKTIKTSISDQFGQILGKSLEKIKSIVKVKINQSLGLEPGQTLNDKLSYLPTKEELFKAKDALMGELKAIREEQAAHDTRTIRLVKIHPEGKHVFAN